MKFKHWVIFLFLGAVWGSSFMWIKVAIREVGPTTLVAYRTLFGLLFGVAAIWFTRAPLPTTFKDWKPLLVIGVTNVAIPFFLISWGEQVIDSAVASILNATVPLFTILIAQFVLEDDRITAPKLAGLLIGFIGVVILMSKDFNGSAGSVLGQLAIIGAAVSYAISAIYIRKATQHIQGIVRSVGPFASATGIMWLGAYFTESPVIVPQTSATWIALLFMGLLGSGLAFILSNYLIHEIGPTRMTMVTYLFPFYGVLLGVLFLHEQLTAHIIFGAALTLISLVVANWKPAPKPIFKSYQAPERRPVLAEVATENCK